MTPTAAETAQPLSSYHRWLFFFLGVAGFFEGYDTFAFTQLLPQIREEMGMSRSDAGLLIGFINIGGVLAYGLVRLADRWGRRRVLTITILGYTACTLLTGLAPSAAAFGAAQLLARVFLVAEWAIATVYAAEEFSAERRGTVIGVIHGLNGFGAIACAGIAPEILKTSLGWRGVYFIGAIPLLLMTIARRSLRETRRFESQAAPAGGASFWRILEAPFRSRMLLLALIWGLTYFCSTTAITFWKEHAVAERGLSDEGVRAHVAVAAVVAMPLAFGAGKLIDKVGRRLGAVVIYAMVVLGTLGSYSAPGKALVIVSLILGMAGITAVGVVLGAYTAELFPTSLRADAFGWSNHLFGRLAPIIAPVVVGFGAERIGWGRSVSLTALFPCAALALILLRLPETRGRELEETSGAR
ncbi:MAG TPA: MFS transporter [Polyangiaceae bacterium]|jgi:putative MFS transporter|nr:MFS transporter [Polyangiaceae bacterium]